MDLWFPPKPAIILPQRKEDRAPLITDAIMLASSMALLRDNASSGGAAGSVWNPADKASGFALSAGNATGSGDDTNSNYARGTVGYITRVAAGKKYFEVTFTGAATSAEGAGIATSAASLGGSGLAFGGTPSYMLQSSTHWLLISNSFSTNVDTGVTPISGDVLNIALDSNAGNVYLGINGTYFPYAGVLLVSHSATINTTPASPPSGYTAWG